MSYAEILCSIVMALNMPNSDFACKHMDTVVEAAEYYDVEPELLISLIHHESRWNPTVVSRSGACGLTQVIPKYTKSPRLTCKQLKRPKTSIWAGAKMLSYWIHKYANDVPKIGVCAYFAGFRCKGNSPNIGGMRYSNKVRRFYRRIIRKLENDVPGC